MVHRRGRSPAARVGVGPGDESGPPGAPGSAGPPGHPVLPRTFLDRPRLRRALDDAAGCTVTEVIGPAGSGKTLGVAGWLARRHGRDGDPGATRWWTVTDGLTAERLRELLDRPGRVVLDNAERLGAACVGVLQDVLDAAPPGLRVVLVTRWDLPLRRLAPVLLGTMGVVRGDVVRLTDDEARALVALHAPACPRSVADAIVGRACGWAAAVVLAARGAARDPAADRGAGALRDADLAGQEAFASLGPRERHVLLAVCQEEVVTARDAVHLSRDAGARAVVEGLEETGLLVQRERPATGADGDEDVFRVHPILLQVVRRRLAAGGPEAERARAAVAAAAREDLARGELGAGVLRTLDGAGTAAAAAVLADHGVPAVVRGEGRVVAQVVRRCAADLEREPRAWSAAAAAAWLEGDVAAAALWGGRLVAAAGRGSGPAPDPSSVALAHLLGAQLGGEDPAAALALAAEPATTPGDLRPAERALLSDLRGAASSWAGDVRLAEHELADAVAAARAYGYAALLVDALSRLAATELLRHRPTAAAELAREALRRASSSSIAAAAADAALARTDPWHHAAAAPPPPPPVGRDLVATYLAHVAAAQRLVLRGRAREAELALAVPTALPAVPEHLRVDLLVRRATAAAAGGDPDALAEVSAELDRVGAHAEGALAAGFRAVLRSAPDATDLLRRAAAAEGSPLVAATAVVTLARLAASRGDAATARRLVSEAAERAEHRGDALPFVGWHARLVPVHVLLDEVRTSGPATAWAQRLARSSRAHGGAGPEARTGVPGTRAGWYPALTAREREVVAHLARGATYADVAEALHLSTNTVKTHVTSLYAKLGASRRSEALATARALELV